MPVQIGRSASRCNVRGGDRNLSDAEREAAATLAITPNLLRAVAEISNASGWHVRAKDTL
eukprot:597669-Lingulodinium_polyedra.AAC.1